MALRAPGILADCRRWVLTALNQNAERRASRRRRHSLLASRFPQHRIGRHSYGWPEIMSFGDDGNLSIGNYSSIAAGVRILLGGEHRVDWLTTYPFPALWPAAERIPGHPATKGDVTIGSDVWIGANVMLLSGTEIGDGAVIGAGSVVAGSIPPYSIAAGNPCRVLRPRFEPDTVSALLAIRWWDWPEEAVGRALPLLLSNDIDGLKKFAEALTRRRPAGDS
jgi:chloramphenicol O-acetyltransferase type B